MKEKRDHQPTRKQGIEVCYIWQACFLSVDIKCQAFDDQYAVY